MKPRQRRLLAACAVCAELARQGVSREQLAKSLQVPMSELVPKLTGELPFDVDELEAVADALGVAVASLLGEAHRRS